MNPWRSLGLAVLLAVPWSLVLAGGIVWVGKFGIRKGWWKA